MRNINLQTTSRILFKAYNDLNFKNEVMIGLKKMPDLRELKINQHIEKKIIGNIMYLKKKTPKFLNVYWRTKNVYRRTKK